MYASFKVVSILMDVLYKPFTETLYGTLLFVVIFIWYMYAENVATNIKYSWRLLVNRMRTKKIGE